MHTLYELLVAQDKEQTDIFEITALSNIRANVFHHVITLVDTGIINERPNRELGDADRPRVLYSLAPGGGEQLATLLRMHAGRLSALGLSVPE